MLQNHIKNQKFAKFAKTYLFDAKKLSKSPASRLIACMPLASNSSLS